jgi:hypothetical protein
MAFYIHEFSRLLLLLGQFWGLTLDLAAKTCDRSWSSCNRVSARSSVVSTFLWS